MDINKLGVKIAQLIREELKLGNNLCPECAARNVGNDAGLVALKVTVCEEVGISQNEFESKSRETNILFARQLFIYIAINHLDTRLSLTKLGVFINKDHTTVMHAKKRAQDLIDTKDNLFTALYTKIMKHYA